MSNPNGRTPANLVGQRFGRLLVISLHHYTYGHYHWNTQCDCGNMHVAQTVLLRNGKVQSCGCLKKENRQRLTHGHTAGGKQTRVHHVWCGMMSRCYTPSSTRYEDWGGRGIIVCDRWHTFVNFLADMGEPPDGMSIDRINNEGNYEKGNCRWATIDEQNSNRRPQRKKYSRVCQVCSKDFMATMPWAKNCSDVCRNEANLRRYYKNKGEK